MRPGFNARKTGICLRGRYYWYKRMIDGVCYYRSLKIKKNQETMLSAQIAQVDEEQEISWFD